MLPYGNAGWKWVKENYLIIALNLINLFLTRVMKVISVENEEKGKENMISVH